jgi:hypothetical protein
MGGGYADPRKLPADLLTEFDTVARRPHYKHVARKVLQQWRSWSKARERYSAVKAPVTLIFGDKDWSRFPERERTKAALKNARICSRFQTRAISRQWRIRKVWPASYWLDQGPLAAISPWERFAAVRVAVTPSISPYERS